MSGRRRNVHRRLSLVDAALLLSAAVNDRGYCFARAARTKAWRGKNLHPLTLDRAGWLAAIDGGVMRGQQRLSADDVVAGDWEVWYVD